MKEITLIRTKDLEDLQNELSTAQAELFATKQLVYRQIEQLYSLANSQQNMRERLWDT